MAHHADYDFHIASDTQRIYFHVIISIFILKKIFAINFNLILTSNL